MTELPAALIAVRDSIWHVEEAAACLRAAVLCDPALTVRLGSVHAQVQDLLALMRERTR